MTNTKNLLRQFDKWRRTKMAGMEGQLYHALNNTKYSESRLLPKDEIKNILIIRNNKRIGNMLFLIPFIHQVRNIYPDANITLMINQPWQAQMFNGMGLQDICFSKFSFKHITECFTLLKKMRTHVYDLILSPNSSVEDTMIAAYLSGRNKISASHPHRQIAFTHVYENNHQYMHTAYNSFYLLEAMGNELVKPFSHHLVLSDEEITAGKNAIAAIATNATDELTLAYFRGARGSKQLTEQQWQNILADIQAASPRPIRWIEILSPDVTEPLNAATSTYSSSNMRILASFLTNVDAFICCDTGPLHLADAANVTCIGLYNETNPDIFGLLGEKSINVWLDKLNPEQIINKILQPI